jgi:hypothetical protein
MSLPNALHFAEFGKNLGVYGIESLGHITTSLCLKVVFLLLVFPCCFSLSAEYQFCFCIGFAGEPSCDSERQEGWRGSTE